MGINHFKNLKRTFQFAQFYEYFKLEQYIWLPCNKSYVSLVNVSKSHMCNLSMYQKSMYLKAMSHIVSVLKVMGSKKSFPSKTHKYSA